MHGHFDANERGVPGFFLRNLDQPFRTAVRGAVKKRDMNGMAITATAREAVDAEVATHMETLISGGGKCSMVTTGALPTFGIKQGSTAPLA